MPITFADIKEAAQNTYAGLSFKVYWALYEWVETFPTRSVAATTPEEELILDQDIVFKSTFRFYELEINQNASGYVSTPVGENGNNSFQNRLTINKSGIPRDFQGWVNHVKNKRLIMLAQDTCGDYRLLGNECVPCQMIPEGEFNTGTPGNAKTSQIVFGNDGPTSSIYTGAIPLTPAV